MDRQDIINMVHEVGVDKYLHFIVGMIITTYLLFQFLNKHENFGGHRGVEFLGYIIQSVFAIIIVTVIAMAKELIDHIWYGGWSNLDILATSLGSLVIVGLLMLTYLTTKREEF